GRHRGACNLEPTRGNERAQPLARRGRFLPSAAGGFGTADSARLHHPAEEPTPELCPVHEPRRCLAGRLPALSRQQSARNVRSARHAHPPRAARKEKSLRQARQAMTRVDLAALGCALRMTGQLQSPRAATIARTCGLTTLIGAPAAYEM